MTRPLRPGDPWGHAASGPPDIEVAGDDTDLAVVAMSNRGVLVRFRPSPRSDLARALGLGPASAGATEVAIDALEIEPDGAAVNAVVLGPPPDRLRWNARAPDITVRIDGRPWFRGRATTVVVASGQFLRGADVVPRGHPGDGWAEVQVYALTRGTHVPHPGIRAGRARRVEIEVAGRGLPVEVDGHRRGRTTRLGVTLVPAAIRLLV